MIFVTIDFRIDLLEHPTKPNKNDKIDDRKKFVQTEINGMETGNNNKYINSIYLIKIRNIKKHTLIISQTH